jgi:hypothetical protein
MWYFWAVLIVGSGMFLLLWLAIFLIKKSVKSMDAEMELLSNEEEPAESYYQVESRPIFKR